MASYLVTGGAGFIGSHLAEALVLAGHKARVLDDFCTGRRENLFGCPDAEIIPGDVRNVECVADAAEGMDGIFHLAALGSVPRSFEDPERTFSTNLGGTDAAVAAARRKGVRRVVLASSSSVYGSGPGVIRRERDPVLPLSPYAESKLAAERLCLSGGQVASDLRRWRADKGLHLRGGHRRRHPGGHARAEGGRVRAEPRCRTAYLRQRSGHAHRPGDRQRGRSPACPSTPERSATRPRISRWRAAFSITSPITRSSRVSRQPWNGTWIEGR